MKGFPEAIEAVYPQTAVQLCLVHMVRHSLNYVSWKMRKVVAADLKTIYSAATADEALLRLADFEEAWGKDYPTIVKSWRSNWERIVPFFEYPPEIRRIIYTTNAIESVNMSLRKVTKSRGSFPSDDCKRVGQPTCAFGQMASVMNGSSSSHSPFFPYMKN